MLILACKSCDPSSRRLLLEVLQHLVLDPLLAVRSVAVQLGVVDQRRQVRQLLHVLEQVGDVVGDVRVGRLQVLELLLVQLTNAVQRLAQRLEVAVLPAVGLVRELGQQNRVVRVREAGHGGQRCS